MVRGPNLSIDTWSMAALLSAAALIVIFLAVRAVRKSSAARKALQDASLSAADLISIDTARTDLSCSRQENIISRRYGISGRPDRVVNTPYGIVPVELKSGRSPRSGPYEAHLAQLAVYCLLVEERYETRVKEGRIQ